MIFGFVNFSIDSLNSSFGTKSFRNLIFETFCLKTLNQFFFSIMRNIINSKHKEIKKLIRDNQMNEKKSKIANIDEVANRSKYLSANTIGVVLDRETPVIFFKN